MASSVISSAAFATWSTSATCSFTSQKTHSTTFAIAPTSTSTSYHCSSVAPSASLKSSSRQNVQGSHASIASGCQQLRGQASRLQCRAVRKTGPAIRAERSYVMIKPDGVQRGLVGEIITRFERKGFQLKGLKLFQTPEDLAKEHYKDLSSKPFYGKLVDYIISGPVVAMIWEGDGVVASARKLIGATNPLTAEPGTIRGDFAVEVGRTGKLSGYDGVRWRMKECFDDQPEELGKIISPDTCRNVVHGSDSPENGEREISLWFKEAEVVEWTRDLTPWLRE